MEKMLNLMRLQVEMLLKQTAKTRIATVSSYDPTNYCAKVRIQPEDTETGWIPVLSQWVGNGWGMFSPPSPGDLVEVQFQEGDVNAGMICQRFFNDNARPLPTPPGEFWLVHKTGSVLKFHNDGSVEVSAASNMTLTAAQTLRLVGQDIQLHATNSYRWDVNGRGEHNYQDGVETWKDNDVAYPHHNHAPPEIS